VVKAGSLRKSTSGKVARAANRAWYLGGHLGAIPDSIERDEALDQC